MMYTYPLPGHLQWSHRPAQLHGKERLLAFILLLAVTILTLGLVGTLSQAASNDEDDLQAATEVPVSAAAPVRAERLEPRMQAALDYVTRRYRVSANTLQPVFLAVQALGRERAIDPLLIVAIIGIESGFNPIAESPMGAQGLMQVIPRFHQDKVPEGAGERPFLDPVTNVRIGVHVLHEAIRTRGSLLGGLQQYAGSSDESGAYASRVLAEKQRLEDAAGRPGGPA